VNLLQLLDRHNVTWRYHLGEGPEPDCENEAMEFDPPIQSPTVPSGWNPIPRYESVRIRGASYQVAHVVASSQFLADVAKGNLPQVA
jgi:hypothetical protein